MFAAQLVGMFGGCFLSPATFQMFVAGQPDLGQLGSTSPAPFAQVYRNMAVVGVGGASELGDNCLWVRASIAQPSVDVIALPPVPASMRRASHVGLMCGCLYEYVSLCSRCACLHYTLYNGGVSLHARVGTHSRVRMPTRGGKLI